MSDDPYPDASEIRWTLTPSDPPLETVDLLTLTEAELLAYTRSLQHEARCLRLLVHEALQQLAEAHAEMDRYGVRIDRLVMDRREMARREGER